MPTDREQEQEHEAAIESLMAAINEQIAQLRPISRAESARLAAKEMEGWISSLDHIRQQAAQARQLRDERDLLRACRNAEIALALKRVKLGKDHGKELMREQRVLYAALIELQEFDAAHIATRQVVKESLTAADTDASRAKGESRAGEETK